MMDRRALLAPRRVCSLKKATPIKSIYDPESPIDELRRSQRLYTEIISS
jgi:hypothetical protein